MEAPQPKTFDEHVQSVHQFARLHLWFLWRWLADHPQESFRSALRERVDIYRKTDFYPGQWRNCDVPRNFEDPRWLDLELQAERLYQRTRHDASRFEEEAMQLFQPAIDRRMPRDVADGSAMGNYPFGSLRSEPPRPDQPRRVAFHISNALEPRSLFDDPAHLPDCFRRLMDHARREYGAEELTTSTWLNEYPRWLALFPKEWMDHMGPPQEEVTAYLGHWGQFINARGLLNQKLERQFRQTGRMPFLPRSSWCSMAAMEAHLAQL